MRAFVLHASAIAFSAFAASPAFASESAQYGEPQASEPNVAYDGIPAGYSYGQQPSPSPSYGYGGHTPAQPPPPPPKRTGPEWNIRANPLELLQGRASFAGEYALTGPLTVALAPTYVFGKPVYVSGDGYDIGGWAIALQPGFWIDGNPFRGYALKLHLEHESVTYRIKASDGSEQKKTLGLNKIGAMLASQSIHGGWFTLSYGFGVKKDLSYDEAEHTVTCPGDAPGSNGCVIAAGIGNGFDLVGEFGLGVVF